jgi:hypothetical protein
MRIAFKQQDGRRLQMATNQWTDDDDFDDLDDVKQPGTDSDLVKQLRKQLREQQKHNKEITEKYESLSKNQKERVIKEVLEAKGVNQKAARLIMKDIEDVNEESVNHWLDDNGDLFGLTREEPIDPQQELDRAALRQQDIVTQSATTPGKEMDALQRLNDAASAEEIIAMIQSGNF